jgi:hypothetical protein
VSRHRLVQTDFFGFFGALKRGDFFGLHPKKVGPCQGAKFSAWDRDFLKLRSELNLRRADDRSAATFRFAVSDNAGLFWAPPKKSRSAPMADAKKSLRPHGGRKKVAPPPCRTQMRKKLHVDLELQNGHNGAIGSRETPRAKPGERLALTRQFKQKNWRTLPTRQSFCVFDSATLEVECRAYFSPGRRACWRGGVRAGWRVLARC